jgi:hypothetical protein
MYLVICKSYRDTIDLLLFRLVGIQASRLWWTYVLAEKLANSDPKITVNAFCPGFIPTTGLGREYPWALRMVARYTFPLVFSNTLTADESAKRYLAYGTDPKIDDDNAAYYRHGEKVESSE